jgi:hypothetical protein
VRGECRSLGAHPGSKRRLAWSRDCDDYEGMVVALLLVAAIAAIWWLVGRKGRGAVQKVVFWLVLLAVLWVVVTRYSAPHPAGLGALFCVAAILSGCAAADGACRAFGYFALVVLALEGGGAGGAADQAAEA